MIIKTKNAKWSLPGSFKSCRLNHIPIDYIVGYSQSSLMDDHYKDPRHQVTIEYIVWVLENYDKLNKIDSIPVRVDTNRLSVV